MAKNDGYQDKGEDEDMEQIGNRISFVKGYTKAEKIAINTKIDRILKELSDMQLGPCSFKLSEEITCVYCQNVFGYSDNTMGLTFKYKDYDENRTDCRNGHHDTYSAKSLFITEYERKLRQDLLNARKVFDLDEKAVFDITYTRADGMDTILAAKNAGVDIDLTPYLELPDLTEDEIEICITKISTFLILCDLAVCLATLYVSFSLVFALMRYLQGKVFLIRFYSPTTLSSSRAEFRLPSRLACA